MAVEHLGTAVDRGVCDVIELLVRPIYQPACEKPSLFDSYIAIAICSRIYSRLRYHGRRWSSVGSVRQSSAIAQRTEWGW